MSVAKVIEIVSASEKSFEDAVEQGLEKASKSLHGITGMEIVHWTTKVENNKIIKYKVTMHVAFGLDEKH